MAVAGKVLRVFYVMLTKGVDYDEKKMFSDIKRLAVYFQKFKLMDLILLRII